MDAGFREASTEKWLDAAEVIAASKRARDVDEVLSMVRALLLLQAVRDGHEGGRFGVEEAVVDKSELTANGYLTFTLHAHLPYVVNHGTWPHGIEWLHEAAAETYLVLLRVLGRLERDGLALRCNLNLSPILLEQLAHPVFREEFPRYLERKIVAAREDEAFFTSMGEMHFAETARFWNGFFREALSDFEALGGDIAGGFRGFSERGLIEIITCGATHGYLPLLGTDESVRAQIRTGAATHERHLGKAPKGIWVPECGYRPAGFWRYPVAMADGSATPEGFQRIGVEQAVAESGIDFFVVDTHMVEESARVASPYGSSGGVGTGMRLVPRGVGSAGNESAHEARRLYQPYYVGEGRATTTVFPRDPRTGLQVWSGELGYPGDGRYLDFHKKRWPGGHRYWRVTGSNVGMDDKQPYEPAKAAEQTLTHARHFVELVRATLAACASTETPPILCAPFDAELFGHWWFEGPLWLEAVVRLLAEEPAGIGLISCTEYLAIAPRAGHIVMKEGSWGAEGTNQVWLNMETRWTYERLYPAELTVRALATAGQWKEDELSGRLMRQMCRELLLLESSDWQFLITTGSARDYAELRFTTHHEQFLELEAMWVQRGAGLSEEQEARLAAIEVRDSVFAEIDPEHWAMGSHAGAR